MSGTQLLLLLVAIGLVALVAILLVLRTPKDTADSKAAPMKKDKHKKGIGHDDIEQMAKEDVERVFNDEFREELRNRGRLHFEKIISENAMFLQQDLRLTTSQLNEFMKNEITRTLKDEFSRYEASINDAKQLAIESMQKTQETIEQQRQVMSQQLTDQLQSEKQRSLAQFEKHMADIVNHYVLEAIGEQIDLSQQLEFILSQMEQHKEEIMQDLRDGA